MVLEALDRAGGVQYLQTQANASPAAFISLLGKVLPMQVNASGGFTIVVRKFGERAGD